MPTGSSKRARRREETRYRLTTAALDLFVERGYDATTAEEIAEAAGFHRATFFRVFESKEDVLLGDINERLDDQRAELERAISTRDPWTEARRILTIESTRLEGADDAVDPRRVMLLTRDPALQSRFAALTLAWERSVAEFFARARAQDPETDVVSSVVATALIGVVRTAMLTADRSGRPVREILEEGFDILEDGGLPLQVAPMD